MQTVFSREIIERCIATDAQINEAKSRGKKMEFSDVNGKLTAYSYNGQTFVTELEIKPEAFDE